MTVMAIFGASWMDDVSGKGEDTPEKGWKTDDRCDVGKTMCPPLGKRTLGDRQVPYRGNRSGVPFDVERRKEAGECVICGQHIDGPKMMEVRCDGSTGCLHGIKQLHMETK